MTYDLTVRNQCFQAPLVLAPLSLWEIKECTETIYKSTAVVTLTEGAKTVQPDASSHCGDSLSQTSHP